MVFGACASQTWWWVTGFFFRCSPHPMGPSFVNYVLSIVNADRTVRVIGPRGDDLEQVPELLCPPEHPPPPSTQVEGAHSGIEDSVQATPTPLKGKDASSEQAWKARREDRAQPSMATRATEEDTRPSGHPAS